MKIKWLALSSITGKEPGLDLAPNYSDSKPSSTNHQGILSPELFYFIAIGHRLIDVFSTLTQKEGRKERKGI